VTEEKTLVIASGNVKKRKEIEELLDTVPCRVFTLGDFPDCPEVEETGDTFEQNAILKAVGVAVFTGHLTLADDSGLVVDALGGLPGVHSARFAGPDKCENSSDEDNLNLLLQKMKDVPQEKRTARFACAMALAKPDGKDKAVVVATSYGTVEGTITFQPAGEYGFGYDPVFQPEGYDQTFAQLGADIKHSMSHRARALQKLYHDLVKQLSRKE